jgi:hypothetical protein
LRKSRFLLLKILNEASRPVSKNPKNTLIANLVVSFLIAQGETLEIAPIVLQKIVLIVIGPIGLVAMGKIDLVENIPTGHAVMVRTVRVVNGAIDHVETQMIPPEGIRQVAQEESGLTDHAVTGKIDQGVSTQIAREEMAKKDHVASGATDPDAIQMSVPDVTPRVELGVSGLTDLAETLPSDLVLSRMTGPIGARVRRERENSHREMVRVGP